MDGASSTGKRRLLTNASFVWIGFAIHIGVAFFMAPVLVHGLGDSRYGIWSLVESVLAYLMLFDIGLGASVVRYVARFEANQDQASLNRLFSTCMALFSGLGAAVMALVLGLAFLWPHPLGVPAELAPDARWLLLILGANLGLQLPLGVYPAVLDGLGRYPTKVVVQNVGLVLRTVLFLVVVRRGGGLVGLGLVTTVCNLVEHLVLALAVKLYLPALRFSWALASWQTVRMIRSYSLDAFWVMVANRIAFQTDAIVIGAFLAPQFITFFAVGARLVEYSKNGFRSAVTVLTPAISELDARGEHGRIRELMLHATRTVLYLVLPIELGLLLLGRPFFALWLGPSYIESSYPTLVILALPLALAISQAVSVRTLYGLGQLHWLARASILQAVLNLVLSIALVKPLGIEGVALGTMIPNVLYCLALMHHVCRAVQVPIGRYVMSTWFKPLAIVPLPALAWLTPERWNRLPGWGGLLVTGVVGVALYLFAAALIEFGPAYVARQARSWLRSMLDRPLALLLTGKRSLFSREY
jgi:O-antigen/teichoic acid export membrane protein